MRKILLLIFILLYKFCALAAQDSTNYDYYVISEENTEKLKQELKYDKTKKQLVPRKFDWKIDEKDPKKLKQPTSFKGLEDIFSAVMYVIAALFILTIIYFIVIDIRKNRTKELTRKAIELDNFDVEDITTVDFDPLLDEALKQGNYRIAVRIKFLRILQQLQIKNYIDWKPNKTNRKYALEISDTSVKQSFRSIANIFDRLWYGNISINKEEYEYCHSLFDNFSNKIR